MDADVQGRIERAWGESKGWITDFDGSPTMTLLINIPEERVFPGIEELAEESENLRITALVTSDEPRFITLDEFPQYLEQLRQGELTELSVNYAVRLEAFDLDIHTVAYPTGKEKEHFALEFVWWSDQVFSSETDDAAQFQALMEYFLHLQEVFGAQQVFVSPERGMEKLEGWVQV